MNTPETCNCGIQKPYDKGNNYLNGGGYRNNPFLILITLLFKIY